MGKKRINAKNVQAEAEKPFADEPLVEVKAEIDDFELEADGLSVRRRAFVEALVGPACGNATRAAQMAGYSQENDRAAQATGARLLSNAIVQEAVAHAFAKRRLSPEWAKTQLVDLAQASMANFVTVDEKGHGYIDLAKAAAMGALGQLKEYREDVIDGDDQRPTVIKRTIKIHDRTTALGLLLKFHGLIKEGNEPEVESKRIKVRRIPANDPGSA